MYRRIISLSLAIIILLAGSALLIPLPQPTSAAPAFPDVIRSLQFEGFLGGSPTEFQSPFYLDTDSSHNLYVSDLNAEQVFRYDANGTFVRAYGTGASGAANGDIPDPEGAAVIGGFLYVLTLAGRVQLFDVNTGTPSGFFALPAGSYFGLSAGPDGNLYITGPDSVLVYTIGGSLVRTIGSTGSGTGQFNGTRDTAFDSLGYLYVVDRFNNRIQKFNRNGIFIRAFGAGTLSGPSGLFIDRADMVWVVDRNNDRIVKFDQKGNQVGIYSQTISGLSTRPGGLADPGTIAVVEAPSRQPIIYVSDLTNDTVSRFRPVAMPVAHTYEAKWGSEGSGNGQFDNPFGVAVDKFGNVYVADLWNDRIQKFDRYGNFVQIIGAPGSGSGQLNGPYGLAIDDARNLLYVADRFNHRVQVFTTSGLFVRRWGSFGTGDGQFNGLTGIALDAAGFVYVAEETNDRVQKFDAYGTFIAKWGTSGSALGQLDGPVGIGVDSARGLVYVTEFINSRVQVFTTSGAAAAIYASSTSGPGQLNNPVGLELDGRGSLYVTDRANDRIVQFDTNGNYLAAFGSFGSGDGQFSGPNDIAIDPATGQLYTVEQGNDRVQRFGSPNVKYDTVGIFRPSNRTFFLRKQNTTGFADITINVSAWAQSTDLAISGDWNCDGIDTVGLYRQSNGTFYLRDNNRPGDPHYTIPFGAPGDLPVVGDWDGDGCDGIGVYRPAQSQFYLKNVVQPGPVEVVMTFGSSTDRPVAGDWNGDGQDTPGVYRPSQSRFFLSDRFIPFGTLSAEYNALLGNPNDVGFSGDWIEQGSSGIGVFRPTNGITYLKNVPASGFADVSMVYGIAGDGIIAGEWGVVPGEATPPTAPDAPELAPTFEPPK